MADVKSFEINGTELMIKDEYARQQLDNIANEVDDIKKNQVTSSGLTNVQINLLKDVLYTMEFSTEELAIQGKSKIDNLISALKGEKTLTSISAIYNGSDVPVGTNITELDITVTANYSDDTTVNITDFEVSGEIIEGENIITITYNEKTTTVTVKGYTEGLVDIKGDVLFEGYYIGKNKDYSFYQLTSDENSVTYIVPVKANTKYTIVWDLDNQYRNPNVGSSNFSSTVTDINNAVWLLCTTSDMKDATTNRTTATFENPTTLNKLYEKQIGDDGKYHTSVELIWASDGYFATNCFVEVTPIHIYEG